jgi:hypothetical protein
LKEVEMGGTCGTYGEKIRAEWDLWRKPEEKYLFGRRERKWKGNMDETDLKQIGRKDKTGFFRLSGGL